MGDSLPMVHFLMVPPPPSVPFPFSHRLPSSLFSMYIAPRAGTRFGHWTGKERASERGDCSGPPGVYSASMKSRSHGVREESGRSSRVQFDRGAEGQGRPVSSWGDNHSGRLLHMYYTILCSTILLLQYTMAILYKE